MPQTTDSIVGDESEVEILNVIEVARFLRVPKSTVYKMVRRGQLPGQKIGKHWRFMRQGIQSWMDGRVALPKAC